MAIEYDEISGRNTTGHQWDDIKELDTPIPKITVWSYGITIMIAVILWIIYPSWPSATTFSKGMMGYSSRESVMEAVDQAKAERENNAKDLIEADLETLGENTDLIKKYQASATVLFDDNCAACHGKNLEGQPSFPNLKDKHWLWSGEAEEIYFTIRYGINSGHDEERTAEMSAFGHDEMLEREDIKAVVEYVLSISGQPHEKQLIDKGKTVYDENCVSCHGEDGEGELENGAPTLNDKIWLYGGSRETIYQTVNAGRKGVMPAWENRLSEADIRRLTLYVYAQSHDLAAEE